MSERRQRRAKSAAGEQGAGLRHARLERMMFEAFDVLLRGEIADRALEGARLTAVELSPDLKHARVWVAPEAGHEDAAEEGLTRATPFIRVRLTEDLGIKRAPDISFVIDRIGLDRAVGVEVDEEV